MTENTDNSNPLFLHLVVSLQSAAMYQMGKTASPVTGKIERDMAQARVSVDMLTMLKEKTKGNLLEEEQKIIDSMVYNLQLNYVDELEKDEKESSEKKSEPEKENSDEDTKKETGEENNGSADN